MAAPQPPTGGPQPAARPNLQKLLERQRLDTTLLESATQIGIDGSSRFIKNLGAGATLGLSNMDLTAAQLFSVMDGGARFIQDQTGLTYGGSFSEMERYFRSESQTLMDIAAQLSPGDTALDQVVQMVGAMPAELAQFMLAGAAGIGFAGLSALRRSDEGPLAAAQGALGGFTIDRVFKATAVGPSRMARAGQVGLATGAVAAQEGAGAQDVLLSAGSAAVLGGITAQPRKMTSVAPEARPTPEAQKETTAGRLTDGTEVKTRHPAIEERPLQPGEQAVMEFMGRDYSDITPPDRVMGLNLKRITGADDFKAMTSDLVKMFGARIDEAKRGKITLQQQRQMASDLNMSVEQMLKRRRGEALNAEESIAFRTINRTVLGELWKSIKKVKDGKGTSEDTVDFLHTLSVAEASLEQTLGSSAEIGRALGSHRKRVGPSTKQMVHLRQVLREFKEGKRGDVEDFAKMLGAAESPGELSRVILNARKATTGEKLMEGWINGLLSALDTHAVNLFSTSANILWAPPSTLGSAVAAEVLGIPKRIRGQTLPANRVRFREAFSMAYGMKQGALDGMVLASKVWKTGQPVAPHEMFQPITQVEVRTGKIGGKLGRAVNIPVRALMSSDAFMQGWSYRMKLRAEAARQALGERDAGTLPTGSNKDVGRRIQDLVDNPTEEGMKSAYQFARRSTFTEDLATVGRGMQKIAGAHHALRLNFPFVRTPTNIFKSVLRNSPAARVLKDVREDIAAGGAKRDLALGQMALGSMAMGGFAGLAAEGWITGSGPADRQLRALWRIEHEPFSIRNPITGKWTSYARLEPFATMMGLAADYVDIVGHVDDSTLDELAMMMAMSFNRNVENKTFIQGFTNLAKAIADPNRHFGRYVDELSATIIPTGVAHLARNMDPVLRDTRGVMDTLRSRIPGLSDTLPAESNVWGQPILLDGGTALSLVNPFYSKPIPQDATTIEAEDLGAKFSIPRKGDTIGGIELTPEEFEEYKALTGQLAKERIKSFMDSPVYDRAPITDTFKRQMIESMYLDAKDEAREEIRTFLHVTAPERVEAQMADRIVEDIGPEAEKFLQISPEAQAIRDSK